MSENQNRGSIDFAQYDSMATEELEEILRLDAEMPQGQESDTDKILYIMEVLAERKRNSSHSGNTAHEAYESFKQNYMPETDDNIIPMKTKGKAPRWVRGLTATAAVLALLIVGSVTANAFGFNIWKAVAQWTQETFHFGEWGKSDPNSDLQFDSLQKALAEGNAPAWLVPTYIPDGFILEEVDVQQTPKNNIYTARYMCGEKIIVVAVRDYLDEDPAYTEQSEGLTEEYESSGVTYYIFTDVDLNKAKWINDSYECSISGNITIKDLKMMIDSIEKG